MNRVSESQFIFKEAWTNRVGSRKGHPVKCRGSAARDSQLGAGDIELMTNQQGLATTSGLMI